MNSIKRNLVWMLLSQASTWVVSILGLLVVPRMVGDEAFGELSFAIVYLSFFELLANMGISTFLVKAIARDRSKTGSYFVNALALKVVLTTFMIVVALVLGVVFGFPSITMQLIAVSCIGLMLNIVGGTVGAALTGLQLMSGLAKWNMIQGYVGEILSLAVLVRGGSLVAFALIYNLAFLISVPPNLKRLWPYTHGERRVDPRTWPGLVRGGFPFFILAGLLVVYGTIDIPLLQAMTGSDEVGWYALAYRWVSVPAFFAATVATTLFPALSAEGADVTPAFVSLGNQALRLVALVTVPAAVGMALVAEPFLSLVYRGQFEQAVPLLRILAVHIPIVGLDIILGSVAMAADKQRQWVIVSVVAAVFNPLLNVVAIPLSETYTGNGAIGAALVTVVTECLLMAGALALRPRGILDVDTFKGLFRITVASAAMVPVVQVMSSAPLVTQVITGVVVYAIASLLLRTISVDEVRRWTSGIRRSPQAVVLPPPVRSVEDVTL